MIKFPSSRPLYLTANEARALSVLVKEAMAGCGAKHPSDFYSDQYTWTDAKTLVDDGWSQHSAAGTYGSLIDKGLIVHFSAVDDDSLTEFAWKNLADGSNWSKFLKGIDILCGSNQEVA